MHHHHHQQLNNTLHDQRELQTEARVLCGQETKTSKEIFVSMVPERERVPVAESASGNGKCPMSRRCVRQRKVSGNMRKCSGSMEKCSGCKWSSLIFWGALMVFFFLGSLWAFFWSIRELWASVLGPSRGPLRILDAIAVTVTTCHDQHCHR